MNNSSLEKIIEYRLALRQISIYNKIKEDNIVKQFSLFLDLISSENSPVLELIEHYFTLTNQLFGISAPIGFGGTTWQYHLINLILTDTNPFTSLAEKEDIAKIGSNIQKAVANDLCCIRAWQTRYYYQIIGLTWFPNWLSSILTMALDYSANTLPFAGSIMVPKAF